MMTDSRKTVSSEAQLKEQEQRPADRRYQVSANRGRARHRLRYVESGGASERLEDESCDLCRNLPLR